MVTNVGAADKEAVFATGQEVVRPYTIYTLVENSPGSIWYRSGINSSHFGEYLSPRVGRNQQNVSIHCYTYGSGVDEIDAFLPPSQVQDIHLPVRGGEILLRIFLPLSPEGGRAGDEGGMAVAIFLHGGGWVVGGVDLEHDLAQDMAIESGAMVVSVGYRLAPEFNFPVPVKDCMAAVRWVRRNIHLFGGDPGRIALVGESAGGNIVLAAAIYLGKWWWPFGEGSGRKQLCAVVAASPPVSYRHAEVGRGEDDGEWRSYRRYWEGYMLNGPQMKGFWDLYLGHPGNGRHPMASPLRASRSQLRRLPPVQLLRAEHEILWDEVVEFGKKLTEAGVEVEEFQSQRCVHGMFAKPGHACGVLSLQAAARFLKDRCS